jgi:hypothetical protein
VNESETKNAVERAAAQIDTKTSHVIIGIRADAILEKIKTGKSRRKYQSGNLGRDAIAPEN